MTAVIYETEKYLKCIQPQKYDFLHGIYFGHSKKKCNIFIAKILIFSLLKLADIMSLDEFLEQQTKEH